MLSSERTSLATPVENRNLDYNEEGAPQLKNRMEDLPPEVLTIILESLTLGETNNTTYLGYRQVNYQWKEIIDSLIEKRIVSGKFPIFQGPMKIFGAGRRRQYDKLRVCTSPAVVQRGGNAFPFNSLLLTGKAKVSDFYSYPAQFSPMTLPVFASSFGGNLTSVAIQDQVIPINNLARILASMPSLKRLNLVDIKHDKARIEPEAVLSTPPPLPNLRLLEVKSTPVRNRHGNVVYSDKRHVLYIWLIASYSDQLERLNLETYDPFPPLRKQHQYSVLIPKGETCQIATTSDAAFGKLKVLKISHPTGNFLNLRETPVLQELSITGLTSTNDDPTNIMNLVQFAVRCGGTLEKLSLDVSWKELLGMDIHREGHLLPTGVGVPKVKTLEIHYPEDNFSEIFLNNELLVEFPDLEVLQLLRFQPNEIDEEIPIEEMGEGENGMQIAADADRVALKQRCFFLRQRMSRSLQYNARAANLLEEGVADEVEPARIRQLEALIKKFNEEFIAARTERELVFRRLTALGEKREKVIVEELIERREIWTTCPNLKIVSVSSGGERGEDVGVIRRNDGVLTGDEMELT